MESPETNIDEISTLYSVMRLLGVEQGEVGLDDDVFERVETGGKPSLLGKLFTHKPYQRGSLIAFMRSLWSLEGWVRFRDIMDDVFLIIFEKEKDKRKVLDGGPWLFSKNILLVKHIEGAVPRQGNVLELASFWVHIFGIPSLGFTKQMGLRIGARLGAVKEVDVTRRVSWKGGTKGQPYMRVQVDLNILQKLPRGIFLTDSDGGKRWVSFRFDRLPNFCFSCGRIGHVKQECSEIDRSEGGGCQYGEWLRANSDVKCPFEGRDGEGTTEIPAETPPTKNSELSREVGKADCFGPDKETPRFEAVNQGGILIVKIGSILCQCRKIWQDGSLRAGKKAGTQAYS